MTEPQNQFQVDGKVLQMDEATGMATVEQVTRRPSGEYKNLLEIHVPNALVKLVEPETVQSFVGHYNRLDGEPRLEAVDIEPADEHFNLAKIHVSLGGVEFFKANPAKKQPQFSSLYGYCQTDKDVTVSAIAFRGLASTVRNLPEGTIMLFGGQLRRKAFTDGSGRFSTDVILATQHTEIIEEAQPKGFRQVKLAARVDPEADAPVESNQKPAKKKAAKAKAV